MADQTDIVALQLQKLLRPFENQSGIVGTNIGSNMLNNIPIGITNAYNFDPLTQNVNTDLVSDIIKANQVILNQKYKLGQKPDGSFYRESLIPKSEPQVSAAPLRFATDDQASFFFPLDTNIIPPIKPRKVSSLGFDTSYGVASEPDVEQVESSGSDEPSGIAKLLKFLMPGTFLEKILPQESPEIRSIKNFYRRNYGLTPTGQVASGIMAGYNPVYGGLLNILTGGRYGKPTQYGLADAARRRIQKIATRKAPQTEASRRKIAELQRFAEADTISRARQAAPDVYRDAGREGRLGPGGGFSTSGREGAFSSRSKSSRGRQDY